MGSDKRRTRIPLKKYVLMGSCEMELEPKLITYIVTMCLGIDTLIISTSLGMMQRTNKVRIALTFAIAEAIMPLFGFFIGSALRVYFERGASLIGAVVLIGVGTYLLFIEDEDDEKSKLGRNLVGWTLIWTALSISLDELAVGLSIGFIEVPIVLTVLLIAVRSFVFSFLGLVFGSRLKPFLGEAAEKIAGVLLALVGFWLLAESFYY